MDFIVTNLTYNHSINIIEIIPAGAKMDNCLGVTFHFFHWKNKKTVRCINPTLANSVVNDVCIMWYQL